MVIVSDWLNVTPSEPAQLIYMDPPYMSQRDYGDFDDRWENREHYLNWMQPRIGRCREHLRDDGSFMLHCDPTASHYLKVMLDGIFGEENFMNDIVWCYYGTSQAKRWFPRKHDNILYYAKYPNRVKFDGGKVRVPYKRDYMPNRVNSSGGWKGASEEERNQRHAKGKIPFDWWDDVNLAPRSSERTGYPTQKPLRLLERIIGATTDPGDLVIDPMCGSGTTLVAAKKLGRRYWGCDINPRAAELAEGRLRETGL